MSFEEHIINSNNKKIHLDGFQIGTSGVGDYTIREFNDVGNELPAGTVLTKISPDGNHVFGPSYILYTNDNWASYTVQKYNATSLSNQYTKCVYDISPNNQYLARLAVESGGGLFLRIFEFSGGTWLYKIGRHLGYENGAQVDLPSCRIPNIYNGEYFLHDMKWSSNNESIFVNIHQDNLASGGANTSQVMNVLYYEYDNVLNTIVHDKEKDKWSFEYRTTLVVIDLFNPLNWSKRYWTGGQMRNYSSGSANGVDIYRTGYEPSAYSGGLTAANALKRIGYTFIDVIDKTAFCVESKETSTTQNIYSFEQGIVTDNTSLHTGDNGDELYSINAPDIFNMGTREPNDTGPAKRPPWMVPMGTTKLLRKQLTSGNTNYGQPFTGIIENKKIFCANPQKPSSSTKTKKFIHTNILNNVEPAITSISSSASSFTPLKTIQNNYIAAHDSSLKHYQKIGNDGKTAILNIRQDYTAAATKPYEYTTFLLSSNDGFELDLSNIDSKPVSFADKKNYYHIFDIAKHSNNCLVIAGGNSFISSIPENKIEYTYFPNILRDRDFKGTSTIDSTNENGLGAGIAYHDLSIKQTSDYTYASNPKTYANLIYGVVIL